MQDRYAGDVGDFSKFALLRVLERELHLPIGMVWYLFPDELHTNDGRHIEYLASPAWTRADRDLVERLAEVVRSGERNVEALERSGVLPATTRYFGEIVHPQGRRAWSRAEWFESAKAAIANCGIICVDPDNGIAGPNHRPNHPSGGKHVTLEEIGTVASRHPCVVIYHHFDRSAKHPQQMARHIERIQAIRPGSYVTAVRYCRVSARAYFIVADQSIRADVERSCAALTEDAWGSHFEWFDKLPG